MIVVKEKNNEVLQADITVKSGIVTTRLTNLYASWLTTSDVTLMNNPNLLNGSLQ